jgi:hypothetical protein
MLVKTFLKIACVSALGTGALISGSSQSFSQPAKLEDPGYGIHLQGAKKEQEKEKESGLNFTAKELNQWRIRQQSYITKYEQRVSEVMSGRDSIDIAVLSLRVLYPRMPYYDPFSKLTIQNMTALAYTADVSDDQAEVNKALAAYRDLLHKHIVNFDVVEYALTLARANPIFGDKIRLKKIYDTLIKNIDGAKEKGLSPEDAYRIVTYGEETHLLGARNVTVKKSEIYKVENTFYNVHDIVDENGKYSQLYFDVTWPIYMYERNKAVQDREGRFSIPAQ